VFRKVLIANRGEIAIRVQRTLRELGIQSVAVYSEADARASHVTRADEAYLLGPAETSRSYLNQDRLLEIAREAGCDAVHPGYGFLSENAVFARRCVDAGLAFIGPPPAAIEAMGTKIGARALMTRAGVPVVPGTDGGTQDLNALEKAAQAMGYPVLVKASAGGGGKGMRVVAAAREFRRAAELARGEAEKSFGDGTIYLEKYLERPRHIEFQVFADAHGNFVHLFERECSIQRRHQKIIEETPSTVMDARLRRSMGDAAVAAARAVDYRGAGTVEFMVDAHGDFYFLEMNTRLQVEHPITEMVTGLDLVRLQLEVAAGHPLPPEALAPVQNGHALECRVYAEDPARGFLPTGGRVQRIRHPGGPGVRVDGALRDGVEVSSYYDPMLAKVITIGRDRAESIQRMQRALAEFVILGVPTNLAYLQAVLEQPAFQRGELSTHFLDEHLQGWQPESIALPDEALAAIALHDLIGARSGGTGSARGAGAEEAATPWTRLSGWRQLQNGGAA
jgi:acetyl-CoA carboxylase biotin carboxylase subunit